MLEHLLIDKPQSKGIAKDWPELLQQVQRQSWPTVPVGVQNAKKWIKVVLA